MTCRQLLHTNFMQILLSRALSGLWFRILTLTQATQRLGSEIHYINLRKNSFPWALFRAHCPANKPLQAVTLIRLNFTRWRVCRYKIACFLSQLVSRERTRFTIISSFFIDRLSNKFALATIYIIFYAPFFNLEPQL